MESYEITMNLIQRLPNRKNKIIFSNESTFELNGAVNKQKTRFWSPENRHWEQDVHTQSPEKLNIWAGIIGNRI